MSAELPHQTSALYTLQTLQLEKNDRFYVFKKNDISLILIKSFIILGWNKISLHLYFKFPIVIFRKFYSTFLKKKKVHFHV